MPKQQVREFNFSKAYHELEELVSEFEKGELEIDQALPKFERGVQLAQELKIYLKTVGNKVEKILTASTQQEDSKL